MFLAPDFDKEFSYTILGDNEVFFVFSPALPVSDQIKKAKELLIESQEEYEKEGNNLRHKGRVQINSLRNYLRYLDAELHGVQQVEMASVIYNVKNEKSASQRISTGLTQAKYYRDKGFLKILKTEILT